MNRHTPDYWWSRLDPKLWVTISGPNPKLLSLLLPTLGLWKLERWGSLGFASTCLQTATLQGTALLERWDAWKTQCSRQIPISVGSNTSIFEGGIYR